MGGMAAARMADEIGHVGIWARLARTALRVGAMAVEALLVAGAVFLITGASLCSFGIGGVIVAGLIAGAIGSATGWNDYKEKKIQSMTEDIGDLEITGTLGIKGAATVLINSRQAMRAVLDAAVCAKHPSLNPNLIAEGSDSVFIETGPAARKGDKLMCAAVIATGSDNVIIGGNKTQYLSIADDKDLWETGLEIAVGLVLAPGKFGARLACLAVGMLSGMAGAAIGDAVKGGIGHPVNPATGGKVLDGSIDTDFILPGPLPIEWRRFYSSHDHRLGTMHGKGWSTPYEIELHVVRPVPSLVGAEVDASAGHLIFIDRQGRHIQMPMVEPGHALFNTTEGFTLGCTPGGAFEVTGLDHICYQFGPEVLVHHASSTATSTPPLRPGTHVLKVQRVRDRFKHWVRLRYDEQQRLISLADHLGRIIRLAYEDEHSPGTRRIASIALMQGAPGEQTGLLAAYEHDAAGQLIRVIDRSQQVTRRFAYTDDADRLMTLQADTGGFECHYAWEDAATATGPQSDGRIPSSAVHAHNGLDRRVLKHWTGDGEHYSIGYKRHEDGSGQTQAVDQLGRIDHWAWDAQYNLTVYQNALGHQWQLTWSSQRELLSATTPEGRTTQFQYDINGMQNAVTNPLGQTTRTLWDANWFEPLAISVPGPGGDRTWRFEYDGLGLLTQETAPDGSATQYAYDEHGALLQITDAHGGKKNLSHDQLGRVTAYTDCSGKTTRYSYDGWGYLASITDALGQVQRLGHSSRGELLTLTLPDGSHQTNTYDEAGRLSAHTDGLSRVSHYRYNARGQLQWRVDAAQRQIATAFDAAHRLVGLATENGVRYEFEYDAADRLTQETRLDGTRVALEYDLDGQVIAVTHYPTQGDDVFHEIETQALEGTLAQGSRSQQTQAPYNAPRRTELIRDALGRLLEKRTAHQVLRYQYDALGQLTQAQRLQRVWQGDTPQETLLHTTRFEYDPTGNLVAEHATDEATGQTHSLRHSHDLLGNRTRTELPLIGHGAKRLQRSLNYLHYGSGHLHQINLGLRQEADGETAGEGETPLSAPHAEVHRLIADLERDDLHREVARSQGMLATRYALDPLGRRLSSWTRAGLSHGIGQQDSSQRQSWQAEWQQQISHLSTSIGDTSGQPNSAGPTTSGLLKAYQYDAVGELKQSLHSHKGRSQFNYDAVGRINQTQRQSINGQTQAEQFAYDPAGNLMDQLLSSQAAPQGQARSQGYIRDNLVRVFEDKRYAYDGWGRLIQKRIAKHTLQRFEWDEQDQLIAVTTTRHPGQAEATTQVTRFAYDALGRRVSKQDAFGQTEFIWEGMRLIEERRGAQVTSYVYEPGGYAPLARIDALGEMVDAEHGGVQGNQTAVRPEPVYGPRTVTSAANDEPSHKNPPQPSLADPWGSGDSSAAQKLAQAAQIYHFHTDPSGLPEELSDDQGQVRWRAAYRTWGNTQVESWAVVRPDGSEVHPSQINPVPQGHAQKIEQNLRFQGQYLDRDTGLHYNTFRFYDPDIGRFISPDPLGLRGGTNLHSYAPNPIVWIDPWGLEQIPANAPGYTVYGLYEPGADKPYYVGIANDTERRAGEHRGTGRLPQGAEMRPIAQDVTYGEARGIERAKIEQYGTKTGTNGYDMKQPGTTAEQRGNRNLGFDTNSPTREAGRQGYFNRAYQAAKARAGKC